MFRDRHIAGARYAVDPARHFGTEKWSASNRMRQKAIEARVAGKKLDAESQHYARLTLVDLFADERTRRITIAAFLMSCTTR